MKVLLDSHTFLWFIAGSSQLSAHAKAVIEEPANDKLVSMVNIWEIAIIRKI